MRILLTSICILIVFGYISSNKLDDNEVANSSIQSQGRNSSESIVEKLKRLKSLRAEVKALTAELRQTKIKDIDSLSESKQNTTNVKPKNQQLKRWKKRIQKRIRRLGKRLDKLERAIRPTTTKKPKSRHEARKWSTTTMRPSSSSTELNITTNNGKLRPGQHESLCSTHNDCIPGHCCHKLNTASKCIKHLLNETSICRHSCQCNSHLHCFKPKDGDDNSDGQSHCKQATTNDFLNGVYENTKMAVFE